MTGYITYVLILLSTTYVINVKGNLRKSALYENRHDFVASTYHDDSEETPSVSEVVKKTISNELKLKTFLPKFIGGKDKTVIYLGIKESAPSDVFISYDYGYTYENKGGQFKLFNGQSSNIDQVYIHPKHKDCMIFVDKTNKVIFSTTNSGRNIARKNLEFTPNSIIYHDTIKNYVAAIDTNNDKQLWLSDNFGSTWKFIHHQTIWTFWTTYKQSDEQALVTFINELDGMALYSKNMYQNTAGLIDIKIKSIYRKNNHVFYVKQIGDSSNYDLYISTKLGEAMKGHFNSKLNNKYFRIVEVTDDGKIFAIVHHSNIDSHLYVSKEAKNGVLYFSLALNNIYSYVPGLSHDNIYKSPKGFDEFYKVEGVTGVYIASRLHYVEDVDIYTPVRLVSLITYDFGKNWRKITIPVHDFYNKTINCAGCSLHLFQNTDINKSPILSSKSAPGVIVATGKVAKNFIKADFPDLYVSTDAGYTWRHSKLGNIGSPWNYRYQIGNAGDLLLTMIIDDKGQTKTQSISVSNDYGKTWKDELIYNKDILVNTFVKTPDDKQTTYTVIGIENDNSDHMIDLKLDFASVTRYDCKQDVQSTWLKNHKYLPTTLAEEIAEERHNLYGKKC